MNKDFDANTAAKMILADMLRLDISFNDAWKDYNKKWYDSSLSDLEQNETWKVITETIIEY